MESNSESSTIAFSGNKSFKTFIEVAVPSIEIDLSDLPFNETILVLVSLSLKSIPPLVSKDFLINSFV